MTEVVVHLRVIVDGTEMEVGDWIKAFFQKEIERKLKRDAKKKVVVEDANRSN